MKLWKRRRQSRPGDVPGVKWPEPGPPMPAGSMLVDAPSDEQIRAYLDAHPDVLTHFLRREARINPGWLRASIAKENRRRGEGRL